MEQSSQIRENTPLQEIHHPKIKPHGVRLLIKRDDLLHPDISGNKWRKLKYNLQAATAAGASTLLTFGGAFSNHIAATAMAAKLFGFQSIGIIRGDAAYGHNPTLAFANAQGMDLQFVSREAYRHKDDEEYWESLRANYPKAYIIPEGGANDLGMLGCREILSEDSENVDYVVTAIGTGTTFQGLMRAKKEENPKIIGMPILKGFEAFGEKIADELIWGNGSLLYDYHFGGYAKYTLPLVHFINDFKAVTAIPLDPLYTGKMMFGVFDLIEKGYFPRGSTIMALHTGGLQGIAGFNQRYGNLIL